MMRSEDERLNRGPTEERAGITGRISGMSYRLGSDPRMARGLPFALLGLFFLVLIRTAWMSDDAYITLRTVDNLVHGHGLRWNIDERVQTFTHPLWMFLEAAFYFVTREAFYTVLFLSVAFSMAAVGFLAFRARARTGALALGGLILLLSRSFVDYSTSGLENPLTHLLVVLFLLNLNDEPPDRRRFLFLGGIAGLAALNRIDSLLLFAPGLLLAWGRFGWRRGIPLLAAAFAPLVVWELFSLFYYGLPVPNTALAKLNTGIGALSLAGQGIHYLENSLLNDPVTLPVIVLAVAAAFAGRRRSEQAMAAGIVLYLAYVVKIGGDFMSGRFLSPLILAAAVLLTRIESFPVRHARTAIAAIVIALACLTPHPSIISGPNFGLRGFGTLDRHGIADERRFYFRMTGLWTTDPSRVRPALRITRTGRDARRVKSPILVEGMVGMNGYYAGPGVHVVDFHALGDPLLSRLPIVQTDRLYETFLMGNLGRKGDRPWRIGHFLRDIPAGYLTTVLTGRNAIEDPKLASFYDRIRLVTKAPLWSGRRLVEIVRLNIGRCDGLIDRTPPAKFSEIRWDEVIAARPDATVAYLRRAELRFEAGDLDGAEEDTRRVLELDPQSSLGYLQLGRIARDRGDVQSAIRAFEKARDLDPADAVAYAHLGDSYLRMGDQTTAIDYFQQALRIDTELSLAYANTAIAYAQLGRYTEALEWLDKAHEISPQNPLISENLGLVHLSLGNRKKAIRMLERAIALKPDLATSLSAAGIAYADEGDDKRAAELLEKAVALDPGGAEAAYRLGLILYGRGDRTRAFDLWTRAAQLGYPPAQKAIAGQ